MKPSILSLVALTLSLLLAPALATDEIPPGPEKSEYLRTTGGGFLMRVGDAGARFGFTFDIRKRVKAPIYAAVTFDNPSDAAKPFVVEETIAPGQKEFSASSPPFTAATNGKIYFVRIVLYSDTARTKALGEHRQGVQFFIDPQIAPRVGVELQ